MPLTTGLSTKRVYDTTPQPSFKKVLETKVKRPPGKFSKVPMNIGAIQASFTAANS